MRDNTEGDELDLAVDDRILCKELYIMKPKTTCHITRQASINAHASALVDVGMGSNSIRSHFC